VRRWLGRVGPAVLGLAAIGGLVFILDPSQVARAFRRFNVALVPMILVFYVGIYVLQGVRWHRLLNEAGVRLRARDSLLLNAAGQSITALIPLGDLTRALFAAEASGKDFGTIAATVTVQELTYTLMLIVFTLPVLMTLHLGVALVVVTAAGMAGIVVILTVSRIFCEVHRVIAHVPLLKRLLPAIDELQHETTALLHRPDTMGWSVMDLARAAASITVFWLIVVGLSQGSFDWWKAAFIVAVSSIGGAVSLIPGGVGANEASVAGLLILFGMDGGTAGAAALIQRFLMTGVALLFGFSSYGIARRRFRLGGVFQITAREVSRSAA
jgi:uncharacterized protein (TIRG00374 family)